MGSWAVPGLSQFRREEGGIRMRTHLLQIAARFLVPVALAGCQETTNLQGERIVDKAVGGPSMRSAVSDSAHRTTVSHFVATGDFANVGWSGETDGFVGVERASNLEGGIFLSYFVRQCVIVEETCDVIELAAGAGPIPAGDLTGGGRKGLKLSTNPSTNTNPDFFSVGPPGLISVQWDPIPGFESRFSGNTDEKTPTSSSHSHGISISLPAAATGSVVGFSIAA
jgi:hypothetical protein